jgi:hypothetical protein
MLIVILGSTLLVGCASTDPVASSPEASLWAIRANEHTLKVQAAFADNFVSDAELRSLWEGIEQFRNETLNAQPGMSPKVGREALEYLAFLQRSVLTFVMPIETRSEYLVADGHRIRLEYVEGGTRLVF